jgi:hypothetical protein
MAVLSLTLAVLYATSAGSFLHRLRQRLKNMKMNESMTMLANVLHRPVQDMSQGGQGFLRRMG